MAASRAISRWEPSTAGNATPPRRAGPQSFNGAAHGLRGVASLLVLLAHIMGGTARHIYPGELNYVRLIEHPWYFGTFGVEIFFVISGFVILPSAMKYDLGEFGLRRFLRLYPLFFVLSLLFIALNAVTNSYSGVNNVKSIWAGLTFTNLFFGTEQLTPNAWSLTFEVIYYVLTGFVVAFAVKQGSWLLGGISVIAGAAFLLSFPITIYFLVGIVLRLTIPDRRITGHLVRGGEMASLGALLWFASRAHFDYTTWLQFRNPVVIPMVISTACYMFLALSPGSITAHLLDRRFFRYVGDVSYSLYLVHPFTYYILRLLFVHFGWFTDDVALSMLLFSVAVVATSFLVTHIVHHLLERWPYQAVFHQRVYRDRNPAVAGGSPC